jgi:hypothetical protein
MRNLLSNGAMIFAGIVSVPAIITTADAKLAPMPSLPSHRFTQGDRSQKSEVRKKSAPARRLCARLSRVVFKADLRLSLLERFFESADAPAKAYSHVFLAEADHYDLDWRLLPSISFVESTGGKWAANNNMFGWDCGRAVFASVIEGIRTVAYNLGKTDRYKDKDLDEVLSTYNPNPEYPRIVKSVMSQIAPTE